MVGYVVEAVRKAGVEDLCAVTGFMSQQVEEYLAQVVRPVLEANRSLLGEKVQLSV